MFEDEDYPVDENGNPLEQCFNEDCEFNCEGFCIKQAWDECIDEF